jgi:hypothetical protein
LNFLGSRFSQEGRLEIMHTYIHIPTQAVGIGLKYILGSQRIS